MGGGLDGEWVGERIDDLGEFQGCENRGSVGVCAIQLQLEFLSLGSGIEDQDCGHTHLDQDVSACTGTVRTRCRHQNCPQTLVVRRRADRGQVDVTGHTNDEALKMRSGSGSGSGCFCFLFLLLFTLCRT